MSAKAYRTYLLLVHTYMYTQDPAAKVRYYYRDRLATGTLRPQALLLVLFYTSPGSRKSSEERHTGAGLDDRLSLDTAIPRWL